MKRGIDTSSETSSSISSASPASSLSAVKRARVSKQSVVKSCVQAARAAFPNTLAMLQQTHSIPARNVQYAIFAWISSDQAGTMSVNMPCGFRLYSHVF